MSLQFLLCTNPNKPGQGVYIYHAKTPRFLAKVDGAVLDVVENFDNVPKEALKGKLSRAMDWYLSLQNPDHAHLG